MKHFDVIYKIAANNYDIVTAAQARELGISKTELTRWADIGRLERRGKGVSSWYCKDSCANSSRRQLAVGMITRRAA